MTVLKFYFESFMKIWPVFSEGRGDGGHSSQVEAVS